MTSNTNPGDFPPTAPAPAPEGYSLVYDFSYWCLFFRFTEIDLWYVQLPERCTPSKLDVNQTSCLIHHLGSTLTNRQTQKQWRLLCPAALCAVVTVLCLCNQLQAYTSPTPSLPSAPGTEKERILWWMEADDPLTRHFWLSTSKTALHC